MEPERKIEKVLRGFAKRRRDEAGTPFELHPATRRLLQGEAARRTPKRDGETFLTRLLRIRVRFTLVEALCVIAIVAVLSALLLPSLGRAKSKGRRLTAMSATRQVEIQRELEKSATAEPAPAPTTDSEGKRKEDQSQVMELRGQTVEQLKDESTRRDRVPTGNVSTETKLSTYTNSAPVKTLPATAPPTVASAPIISLDTNVAGGRGNAITTTLAANEPHGVVQNVPGVAGGGFGGLAAKDQDGKTLNDNPGTIISQKFVRTSSQTAVGASASNANAVLASFDVFQNGRELRIVDGDGSVYTGSLQPQIVATSGIAVASADFPKEAGLAKAGNEEAAQQKSEAFSFRVSGTNQTLKQNVFFAGNFFVVTNALSEIRRTNALDRLQPSAAATPPPAPVSSNLRINGTVQIGSHPEVKMEAAPLPPPR